MSLFFRWFWVLFKYRRTQKKIDMHGVTSLVLRCLPNDLDLNMHMNNGRYLTIMDLGRLAFMGETRVLNLMLKYKWVPILGKAEIKFIRSIAPFEKFSLDTQMDSYDDQYFYFKQVFRSMDGKKTFAIATVRGLLMRKNPETKKMEKIKPIDIIDMTQSIE